jgi:hypothetical protein
MVVCGHLIHMNRFFKPIVGLTALWLSFSLGAMALGRLQPLHPAIRDLLAGCDDPARCWHGVTPGISTLKDAELLWRGAGYRMDYSIDANYQKELQARADDRVTCRLFADAPIADVEITREILAFYCQPPQLGDVILAMGEPVVQVYCSRLELAFLRLPGDTRLNRWWKVGELWSPFAEIDSLFFNVQRPVGNGYTGQFDWRGFAPVWRYCQAGV